MGVGFRYIVVECIEDCLIQDGGGRNLHVYCCELY